MYRMSGLARRPLGSRRDGIDFEIQLRLLAAISLAGLFLELLLVRWIASSRISSHCR
jgi:hypothetical protein